MKAWCKHQNGPCVWGCESGECAWRRVAVEAREPVIPQPRRMDGTPFDEATREHRVPHGMPIGVIILLCYGAMAFALGVIIGRALQ